MGNQKEQARLDSSYPSRPPGKGKEPRRARRWLSKIAFKTHLDVEQ
jgi:hypothetical protein